MRVEVSPERREEPCLGGEQLAALLEVARRIEGHFGTRQDIEWAIARGRPLPDALVRTADPSGDGAAGSRAEGVRLGHVARAGHLRRRAPTTEAVLMPLSEDDVREILRLIDESDDEELRVETEGFSLYVRRSGESSPPPTADGQESRDR